MRRVLLWSGLYLLLILVGAALVLVLIERSRVEAFLQPMRVHNALIAQALTSDELSLTIGVKDWENPGAMTRQVTLTDPARCRELLALTDCADEDPGTMVHDCLGHLWVTVRFDEQEHEFGIDHGRYLEIPDLPGQRDLDDGQRDGLITLLHRWGFSDAEIGI